MTPKDRLAAAHARLSEYVVGVSREWLEAGERHTARACVRAATAPTAFTAHSAREVAAAFEGDIDRALEKGAEYLEQVQRMLESDTILGADMLVAAARIEHDIGRDFLGRSLAARVRGGGP